MRIPRRRAAFSLIELLVVVAIVVVLISMLMPGLRQARDAARTVACVSILKQFSLANVGYMVDNRRFHIPVNVLRNGRSHGLPLDTNISWMKNPSTYIYLNLPVPSDPQQSIFPEGLVCPSKTGNRYLWVASAYNRTGMDGSATDYEVAYHPAIRRPAATVQMADCNNWFTSIGDAAPWRWESHGEKRVNDGGLNAVAYRHAEAMNAITFDGSARGFTKDEAYPAGDAVNDVWWLYGKDVRR